MRPVMFLCDISRRDKQHLTQPEPGEKENARVGAGVAILCPASAVKHTFHAWPLCRGARVLLLPIALLPAPPSDERSVPAQASVRHLLWCAQGGLPLFGYGDPRCGWSTPESSRSGSLTPCHPPQTCFCLCWFSALACFLVEERNISFPYGPSTSCGTHGTLLQNRPALMYSFFLIINTDQS